MDLSKLAFSRMVIEESMRLYPPVHTIVRQALADDTLAGRQVPKGSIVLISPWVLHRHQRLWHDPGRFDPERFSPSKSPRDRASRTFHSAADAVSVSDRLSPSRRRRFCSPQSRSATD